MIDEEGVFKSGMFRICARCLGDIDAKDNCTYIEGEISCMACAIAYELPAEEWENEGGPPNDE